MSAITLEEIRRTGWKVQVLVDGSFVMPTVDRPEDIDVIVVLPPDWDFEADIPPFAYNLFSRKRAAKMYGLHVFAVASFSHEEFELVEFFQRLNPKWIEKFGLAAKLKKGIVRVLP